MVKGSYPLVLKFFPQINHLPTLSSSLSQINAEAKCKTQQRFNCSTDILQMEMMGCSYYTRVGGGIIMTFNFFVVALMVSAVTSFITPTPMSTSIISGGVLAESH